MLGPSSFCLTTCVAWVSDFFNISWVFLAPDTSPTLFFTGTCYTFNTLVVEFCLGRHLSVCLHASRGCPIFLNICWVSLVPVYRRPCFFVAPAILLTGLCSNFAWAVIFLFDYTSQQARASQNKPRANQEQASQGDLCIKRN